MNVLNGGVHADNPVDFQEFMIAPVGARSFAEALRIGAEVYHELKATLEQRGLRDGRRRRGRLRPGARIERGAARAARRAIDAAGYRPGDEVAICLDPAAQRVLSRRPLRAGGEGRSLSSARDGRATGSIDRATGIRCCSSRTDWPRATGTDGGCSPSGSVNRLQLVGDDIFVTNPCDPARRASSAGSPTRS